MKMRYVALALLIALLALAGAGYLYYQASLRSPLQLPPEGRQLVVAPGSSIETIIRDLRADGVLAEAWPLRVYARLQGFARRIKAGEYRVQAGTTPIDLIGQLVAGRVEQHGLTVVEGWTFRQLREAMRGQARLRQTLAGVPDAEVMTQLGRPGEHPEGRFFPDTYHFPAGTTDVEFLRRAYRTMEQRLQAVWAERAADLPLASADEALILASIIERETGQDGERAQIGGVFARRLRIGMPLQSDPTVIYGMGEAFDGNIRRSDLRRDTPYNTYTRRGLPPTPIALPGAEALRAAVRPAAGNTLYFVARGDGSHVFSATLQEHNRAVSRYQRGGR